MAQEKMLTHEEVEKQARLLVQVAEKMKEKKNPLLEKSSKVNLQFATKKQIRTRKIVKLNLPNGLGNEYKEVCLFVKDLDKKDREYEKSVRHFKTFLQSKGVTAVTEIIPLKALKLEHKPFEAKRNLASRFDVFLADSRIIRLLPSYLGKAFYGKKKIPIQVHMNAANLKAEFEGAINNSRCILDGKGTVAIATVGNTNMSVAELVQNITASAEQIAAAIPGGSENIRNFYIKTEDSLAIPIYVSTESSNKVTLPKVKTKKEPVMAEEVTTVENALVKVYPSGTVKLVDLSGKLLEQKKTHRKKPVKRLGKKPQGDKSAGKKPEGDKSAGKKPEGDKSAGKKPLRDKSKGTKGMAKKPADGKKNRVSGENKKPTPDKTKTLQK